MAFLIDNVFDSGLSYVQSNGTRLDICSDEPTNYTQATSTLSLGNKTSITVGAVADHTPDGRKVEVPAFTDGSVTGIGTQTATHWALTNGTDTLIATGSLSVSQSVTNGNTFTLTAITIALRDATTV